MLRSIPADKIGETVTIHRTPPHLVPREIVLRRRVSDSLIEYQPRLLKLSDRHRMRHRITQLAEIAQSAHAQQLIAARSLRVPVEMIVDRLLRMRCLTREEKSTKYDSAEMHCVVQLTYN